MKSVKGIAKMYAEQIGLNLLVKDMKNVAVSHKFAGAGNNYHVVESSYLITMKTGTQYCVLCRESKPGSAIMKAVDFI